MDDFENNSMEGMEPDTIIFEDEDGNEYEFAVRDYFFYNGDEYALLTELGQDDEEDEECIICKVVAVKGEDGEEDEEFVLVEDEELAGKLIEIANTRIADDEEE